MAVFGISPIAQKPTVAILWNTFTMLAQRADLGPLFAETAAHMGPACSNGKPVTVRQMLPTLYTHGALLAFDRDKVVFAKRDGPKACPSVANLGDARNAASATMVDPCSALLTNVR